MGSDKLAKAYCFIDTPKVITTQTDQHRECNGATTDYNARPPKRQFFGLDLRVITLLLAVFGVARGYCRRL
jgi:hypothetical protein